MNFKKTISLSTGIALLASMAIVLPAFAQTNTNKNFRENGENQQGQGRMMNGRNGIPNGGVNRGVGMMRPGVSGIVTTINGNIITITGHQGFGTTTTASAITYSIDATNAKIRKNNATSTVASILVGDRISAQGTITGTNVIATNIFDGIMIGRGNGMMASSTAPAFIGNGQPVVAGTVSVINGSALTITTTSNVTYSIDATNAKILNGKNAIIVVSSIIVGDKVLVQGVVNGNSIVASTVIDQSGIGFIANNPMKAQSRGFLGGIGQFFSHLFGF